MGKKIFVFGGISPDTPKTGKQPRKPKQKKVEITNRYFNDPIDSVKCKQRVKHPIYLCNNDSCKCQYKEYKIDDIYLLVNRFIISGHFFDYQDKYLDYMFCREWKSDKLNNKYGEQVYHFIKQCKFVYDLDILVKRKKLEKVNTATEAVMCNDRIKGTKSFCIGCKINNEKYQCYYSKLKTNQVNNEVLREFYIKSVNKDIISKWDKIVLTFNWGSLTKNQEKMVENFISFYKNIFPNTTSIKFTSTQPKKIIKNKQPIKRVKRKKITP